jgi:hypothetical protein
MADRVESAGTRYYQAPIGNDCEPLGDLGKLVERFGRKFGLPEEGIGDGDDDLSLQVLQGRFQQHLEESGLLKTVEERVRPIIVEQTPQFVHCGFFIDARQMTAADRDVVRRAIDSGQLRLLEAHAPELTAQLVADPGIMRAECVHLNHDIPEYHARQSAREAPPLQLPQAPPVLAQDAHGAGQLVALGAAGRDVVLPDKVPGLVRSVNIATQIVVMFEQGGDDFSPIWQWSADRRAKVCHEPSLFNARMSQYFAVRSKHTTNTWCDDVDECKMNGDQLKRLGTALKLSSYPETPWFDLVSSLAKSKLA